MFFSLLLILFPLLNTVFSAGPVDKNCTVLDGVDNKYTDRAVLCDNAAGDVACDVLYPKPVVMGSSDERPDACFKKDGAENEDLKKVAIKTCAKNCGYCCLNPAFNCRNADFPRVRCETVTQSQCKDPKWRQVLAEDCPNICGFCLDESCVDTVMDCTNDPAICRQMDMQAFVKENCKKTCGYCGGNGHPDGTKCGDSSSICKAWKHNGFCESKQYSLDEKKRYCGTSCGLC